MPRSPQNCRTARSQPIAAKHLFCTMAGVVDAPAWSSASCATAHVGNAEEPCRIARGGDRPIALGGRRCLLGAEGELLVGQGLGTMTLPRAKIPIPAIRRYPASPSRPSSCSSPCDIGLTPLDFREVRRRHSKTLRRRLAHPHCYLTRLSHCCYAAASASSNGVTTIHPLQTFQTLQNLQDRSGGGAAWPPRAEAWRAPLCP